MQPHTFQPALTRYHIYPFKDKHGLVLSAIEAESNDSNKLPENNEEESSETTNDLKKNDETLPRKVLHSVEGDLHSYKATEMNLKLAKVFAGKYIRNHDGSHFNSGIKNDDIW